MPQITGLTTEKTTLEDTDYGAIDDSTDSNKSKKFRLSNLFNYIIGKFSADVSEINSVCNGNTATASEISQICDGRTAGGTDPSDLVTVNGTQSIRYKRLRDAQLNDTAVIITNGTQLNTLANTTGSGRVNEVQQGFNVGNPTIVASSSFSHYGLVNINLPTSDSVSLGPVSGFNVSAIVVLKNISATTNVTVNRSGSDRFYSDAGYTSIVLQPGEAVTLMAIGDNKWMVLGHTDAVIS